MKAMNVVVLTVALMAAAVTATTVQAQTAPKMTMTTDIPPGIAIPVSVNTRLGECSHLLLQARWFLEGGPSGA